MVQRELTIGEACAQFDVTARALRFYEDKGLISPRRVGMRRLYGTEEVKRLKLILRAKRFGFTLTQIQRLLDMSGADTCAQEKQEFFQTMARKQLEKLEQEQSQIAQAISDLRKELAATDGVQDIKLTA